MFGRVVNAFKHDIFERNALSVRQARIITTGLHELRQRIFLIDGHYLRTQLIIGSMQRDSQHSIGARAHCYNIWYNARGGDCYAAAAN